MSDAVSLAVQHGSLETMLTALQAAHDDIETQMSDLVRTINLEVTMWGASTASRAAHDEYQARLASGVEELNAALMRVHTALAAVKADAHDVEVENVAIVD